MTKNKNHNPESVVREIKRKTRKKYSSEEKIRRIIWNFLQQKQG